MIKTINQIFVFALELVMIFGYGYFAITRPWNLTLRILFSITIITVTILLWAVFAAPKSGHRLEMPYLAIFRAFMFLIAALFLFQMGHKYGVICLVGLIIITQAISYLTER